MTEELKQAPAAAVAAAVPEAEAPLAEAPAAPEAPEAAAAPAPEAEAPEAPAPEAPEVQAPEAADANAAAAAPKPRKKSRRAAKTAASPEVPAPVERESPTAGRTPLRWYVIQAFSGFEHRVALTLRERIRLHHMEEDFGEVLVPKEKVKEIKDGKKHESERKFFPGYVLIHMRMSSKAWQLVKHTDRVLGFIGGTADKPLPITESEAARILNRLKESEESPRPKTIFEVGESVRVIEGAFKDFVGVVEKVDYEKNKLSVSIAIFGRGTPVDLDFSQVEKDL